MVLRCTHSGQIFASTFKWLEAGWSVSHIGAHARTYIFLPWSLFVIHIGIPSKKAIKIIANIESLDGPAPREILIRALTFCLSGKPDTIAFSYEREGAAAPTDLLFVAMLFYAFSQLLSWEGKVIPRLIHTVDSLSRNPKDYETLRDIRTSTYQIFGPEENN